MSNHLSQDQFEDCVLGRAGTTELEHINTCRECRAGVDDFRNAIEAFRNAVHRRVAVHAATSFPSKLAGVAVPPGAAGVVPKWRWALVAAGFAAAIVLPLFMSEKITPVTVDEVSTEMSPEAVMERLNLHLSRRVPAPMEPMFPPIPGDQFQDNLGGVQ